jgi:hypothetical protein
MAAFSGAMAPVNRVVCDEIITSAETEYEVTGPMMIVRVHVACYHAWSGESQRSA